VGYTPNPTSSAARSPDFPFQPGKPYRQSFAGSAGNFEDLLIGIELPGTFPDYLDIAIRIGQQVDLIDQEGGTELKH